ncbi:hypothetical protein V2J09_022726 [Rumex salicifolius]
MSLWGGIDYFTKWVEAEPLAKTTTRAVKNFLWKSILRFATIAHPQSNDQIENVNARLLDDIKRRASGSNGKWVELFLEVYGLTEPLLASIVYGMDAMVPIEILTPSGHVHNFDQALNEDSMLIAMHLHDELHNKAMLKEMEFKRRTRAYHNKKVKPQNFVPGDLMLKRSDGGKFDYKWDGPFILGKEVVVGTFNLCDKDWRILRKTWNAAKLKKYYV